MMIKTLFVGCRRALVQGCQTLRALKRVPVAEQTLTLWVASSLLITSGCGFHLRGQMPLSQALQNVNVSSNDPSLQPIEAQLIRALRQRGAQVNLSYARTRIDLSQPDFSRYQINTNTDASAASYEYRYQIHYRLTDLFKPDRPAVIGHLQSRMTQLSLDNNTIGQEHAEHVLKQRMEADLAQRLLQRLTFASQRWDTPISAETSAQAQQPIEQSTKKSTKKSTKESTKQGTAPYAP